MRILLRLPNWVGDGVMLTPAFEALKKKYQDAKFVIVGNAAVCDLYRRDARVEDVFVDRSKQAFSRFFATMILAREIGACDLAITFANHFYPALLLYFTRSKRRIGFCGFLRRFLLTDAIKKQSTQHQVLSYMQLLQCLEISQDAGKMRLISEPMQKDFLTPSLPCRVVGIGAGAAYGSAKAWLREYFAEVITFLLEQKCRVLLLGSSAESMLNQKIIALLKQKDPSYPKELLHDMSGKTSITELVDVLAGLDLFIGNDSGPTQIAAALDTPLIVFFGPTPPTTLPWKTENAIIFNKHVSCAPCKQRECPLKHHACMREIKPEEVISAIKEQFQRLQRC
ncbi:ADP-heptose--LPS heptosyltransferase [Helicobacter mustelae]|uniref:lipopolysaccharide heptosyltransferase II n=1 Tax=Helicobacter mustelae TaxID=217 RepID=UPI000DF9E92C|nr:lipopolysaccharide heptosyltransferase II [Helicobacter mustelae]STP12852.1 ADP-heptose--LPS heptosyltransferase [Helicobacter mustelae]